MRSNKGFTLSEVVISMMLLGIVWIAALGSVLTGKSMGSVAKHRTQAAYVVQRAVEELHRKPFPQIAASTSSVSIDTNGTPDSVNDDLIGTQIVTVTAPSAYYKKVVVEVSWNERLLAVTKTMRERCGTFICNDPQAN